MIGHPVTTTLRGVVADQAQPQGGFAQIRDLGITPISITPLAIACGADLAARPRVTT